jgi:hypothetical protein
MNYLLTARICLLVVIAATLNSVMGISGHVVDPQFPLHAQFHFSREIALNLGAIAVAGLGMFSAARHQNRITWSMMAAALLFLTGGFWVGLVITGATIPNFGAGANHAVNTAFALLAMAFSWKPFNGGANSS